MSESTSQPDIAATVRVKRKRPWLVTSLADGVLMIGGLYLVRFLETWQHWDYYLALPGIHPAYLAATGLIWATAMLALVVGLRMGRRWAYRLSGVVLTLFALYFWLDRLFLAQPVSADGRDRAWPFWLALTALALAYLGFVLMHKSTRLFFGGGDEH